MKVVRIHGWLVGLALATLTGCAAGKKQNCPAYLNAWPGSSEKQVASDGKKAAGENLANTTTGARTTDIPLVRVSRDKNGLVSKKQPKKPKKRTY